MYNKVYKNYQVSLGLPFQINKGLSFDTIKHVDDDGEGEKGLTSVVIDDVESSETKLENARLEAEMIIKEARYEAERIIMEAQAAARENAVKIEEEAKINGFENGYNVVKQQYEDLLMEAEYIKEHARVEYKEVLDSIEADAVNVILDISRKVLGMELGTNKEVILSLIKQAFEKCGGKENVILKVSPEEYDCVCGNKDKILTMAEGIGELEIKKDSSLKSGGCVIETPYGTIDASMQTKFKKIEEAFRNVILENNS